MTKKELNEFESKLEKKGYKKYPSIREAKYAWYKSFGESDKEEDRSCYQIAFNIYDFSPYVGKDSNLKKNPYSCQPAILLSRTIDERVDIDLVTQCYKTDIDKVESLAEKFLEWAEQNIEL